MTNPAIQALIDKHFAPGTHPYAVLRRRLAPHILPGRAVLEIGCGRTAPMLSAYRAQGARLIGVDLVDFTVDPPDMELIKADVADMAPIADDSIDLCYSRSVMEHVEKVDAAYREVARILAPGGRYIFLTPNLWDYGSLIAKVVPNRFHAAIVRKTEGRNEEDTFPTQYRSNTYRAINRLSMTSGLRLASFEYLGQYPNYLAFNRHLFELGCWYAKFLDRHRSLAILRGWILAELEKPLSASGGER